MGLFGRSNSSTSSSSEEGKPKKDKPVKQGKPQNVEGVHTLQRGEDRVLDKNGDFECVMQTDGNLVVYNKKDGNVVWATNTEGSGNAPFAAILDEHGHFCVRDSELKSLWQCPQPGGYIEMDGKHLTLKGADGHLIWSSD